MWWSGRKATKVSGNAPSLFLLLVCPCIVIRKKARKHKNHVLDFSDSSSLCLSLPCNTICSLSCFPRHHTLLQGFA